MTAWLHCGLTQSSSPHFRGRICLPTVFSWGWWRTQLFPQITQLSFSLCPQKGAHRTLPRQCLWFPLPALFLTEVTHHSRGFCWPPGSGQHSLAVQMFLCGFGLHIPDSCYHLRPREGRWGVLLAFKSWHSGPHHSS